MDGHIDAPSIFSQNNWVPTRSLESGSYFSFDDPYLLIQILGRIIKFMGWYIMPKIIN